MHMPFKVKYVLNRNLNAGAFSKEENKNMKKMVRADRLANELVIFSDKRRKKIEKAKSNTIKRKMAIIEEIKRNIKISEAKKSIEKKRKEKLEKQMAEMEEARIRENKINRILQNKKVMRNTNINTNSGCKIYNVDRREENRNITNNSNNADVECVIYDLNNLRRVAKER